MANYLYSGAYNVESRGVVEHVCKISEFDYDATISGNPSKIKAFSLGYLARFKRAVMTVYGSSPVVGAGFDVRYYVVDDLFGGKQWFLGNATTSVSVGNRFNLCLSVGFGVAAVATYTPPASGIELAPSVPLMMSQADIGGSTQRLTALQIDCLPLSDKARLLVQLSQGAGGIVDDQVLKFNILGFNP